MLKAQSVRAGSHDHNDVGAWLQLCTMQSKNFTHEPLCTVALDRSADLATRRDSEAGLAGLAGTLEHQKMSARLAVSFTLDSKEIPALTDTARPCQPKVRLPSPRFGRSHDHEAFAPFRASPLQHESPAWRGHASSKTMPAPAPEIAGLVRSFHGRRSSAVTPVGRAVLKTAAGVLSATCPIVNAQARLRRGDEAAGGLVRDGSAGG